jgi:hypothetical protein
MRTKIIVRSAHCKLCYAVLCCVHFLVKSQRFFLPSVGRQGFLWVSGAQIQLRLRMEHRGEAQP